MINSIAIYRDYYVLKCIEKASSNPKDILLVKL